ncbi:MAG: hypothetical protein KME19_22600 [Microcoleus vaginatus WJT46-NPBG5]|nr:hypothetical protein [Microcoleus vaginatus WJT46-NPBG5]
MGLGKITVLLSRWRSLAPMPMPNPPCPMPNAQCPFMRYTGTVKIEVAA